MLPGGAEDGGDVDVKTAFNITAVPSLLMYQTGDKALLKPLNIDAQSSAYLLQSAKTLYTQLTMFVPSLAHRVTHHSLNHFLTEVRGCLVTS